MKLAHLAPAVFAALAFTSAFACGGSNDDAGPAASGSGSSGAGGGTSSAGNGGSSTAGKGGAAGSAGKAGTGGAAGTSGKGGSAGAAGTSAGAAGTSAGAAGTSAGAAGAGAGGTSAGAGGTSAGAAGTSAGAAGTSAGAAGTSAGAGGMGGTAGASGAAGGAGSPTGQRWLMGYYPGYQQSDLPPADVRFDLMSHVAVGAVLPKSDGSLDIAFYQTPQTGPAFAKDLADRAHKAGRKAVLMVGGAGAHDGFAAAASKPGTRSTLVANLVDFAKAHSFDGFDLDWEPLPEPELDDFGALAAGLRAAWPEAVITVPLGGINVNFETVSVKWATISSSLDQVNLMTYSMAGAYQGWKSWHHSPLDGETPNTPTSISSSVDAFLAAGVPAAKLGIGAGFYGLCYTSPVTGPNQDLGAANAIGDDNQLAYRTLMSTYFTAAANKWDAPRAPRT